ncbi:MAG: hypothetical protein KZQ58_03785, partial [gamma proteobacterium symbiont of Bathyaustriella thionipta]|nr:hypothetical protein [gamma proteobacterium symbiont of Bathyaustriella thionipta]
MQDFSGKRISAVSTRPRILFVGESVSLAHVTRPWVLAQALDAEQYEVHLACSDKWRHLLAARHIHWHNLHSISSEAFMAALSQGRPIYSEKNLSDYIEADLELISQVKPDFIVADFRLSLSISAKLAAVPYANLCNAYWSAYRQGKLPVPDHKVLKILGVGAGSALMQGLLPLFMKHHAKAINRLRKRHGFPSLGSLQSAYTYGDYTLYCDLPRLFPVRGMPKNHRYIVFERKRLNPKKNNNLYTVQWTKDYNACI